MVLMVESKLNWNWNSIEEGTPAPVTQATCPANAAEFRGERVSGFGFRVSGPALMWSGAFVVFVLGKFYFSRFFHPCGSKPRCSNTDIAMRLSLSSVPVGLSLLPSLFAASHS